MYRITENKKASKLSLRNFVRKISQVVPKLFAKNIYLKSHGLDNEIFYTQLITWELMPIGGYLMYSMINSICQII